MPAIPVLSLFVGAAGALVSYSAQSRQANIQKRQISNAQAQADAQAEYDKEEARRVRDEEVAADIAAKEEADRQSRQRTADAEADESARLEEEERVRAEQERQERERFDQEKRAAWSEYDLEVTRLSREADVAALQAEEEIDASRLRTQHAQEDINKHEELVSAAQTAGFAARGLAPGSESAAAVMKRSADLAEGERIKLQENFDLFAGTRRTEALRVKESGELSVSQLSDRIKLAEGKGRLSLQHMRERGDIAAEVGEFSLSQFKASNSRELEFASTFLDMDIAAARRKGEKADRAIAAIEENEQYVSTGFALQSEAADYSQRYNSLGIVTGIAGQGLKTYTALKDEGFFATQKSPFFMNRSGQDIFSGGRYSTIE